MTFLNILIVFTLLNIAILRNECFADTLPLQTADRVAMLYSSGRTCRDSMDCLDPEKCEFNTCLHVCLTECVASHETCSGVNHTGVCYCEPGFLRNAEGICEIPCSDSSDCRPLKECVRGHDGTNRCECQIPYIQDQSNPDECELSRVCHNDNGCQDFEKCVNNICIDACSLLNCTQPNEGCLTINNKASCVCKVGYGLTINRECKKIPCVVDEDCGVRGYCSGYPLAPVCACEDGYNKDYRIAGGGLCRKRCMYNGECTDKNTWCNGIFCVPCDGIMCSM